MDLLWEILKSVGIILALVGGCIFAATRMTPEERDSQARAMDEFLYGEDWRD